MPSWALITMAAVSTAAQRAERLADEVGIAGRVEQLKCLPAWLKWTSARLDRVLVVLFFFVEIANAGAVVDAGRPLDGAGRSQNLVGQHRLAGVADDHKRQCCEYPER